MIHLRKVQINRWKPWPQAFPYTVAVIASLQEVEFSAPVTFLVGENGSGKSTFLETLATAIGSITVGSQGVNRDKTLAPLRELSRDFRLVWNKRTRKGFFMRSEDFFGYARQMDITRQEMEDDLRQVDEEYKDRSDMAKNYARMAYAGQLGAMREDYGEGVDARSHGESYLKLFQNRFIPGGLYLLDEPEAPLSPRRQLAFLVLLKEMVKQQAQFIIATHSPILLGYPGASILSCDSGKLEPTPYEELEHVLITRDFLTHRPMYLKNLGLLDEE